MAPTTFIPPRSRAKAIQPEGGLRPDGTTFRIPHDATSLEGFRAWVQSGEFPDSGRIAFIRGEVFVDTSKEELSAHALVKTEIGRLLAQLCRDRSLGMTMIDGCYVVNETANIANIPDVVFVSFDAIESGRATLTPRKGRPEEKVELAGSPDVVVEVVSNSSEDKDVRRLRTAYHAANIPEYWLVDARGDDISFQILAYRRTGYVAAPSREGWIRSRIFEREFRLTRVKNRIGVWEYRLEARGKGE